MAVTLLSSGAKRLSFRVNLLCFGVVLLYFGAGSPRFRGNLLCRGVVSLRFGAIPSGFARIRVGIAKILSELAPNCADSGCICSDLG